MAVVLSPEESNYFSSSPFHRSHSQPKFITHQTSCLESPSKSKNSSGFNTIISPTNPASFLAPSPPRTLHANSTAPLYASTPTSNILFNASQEDQDDEDQIVFPSYHDVGYYGQIEDLELPTSSWAGDPYTVSLTSNSTSTNLSRQESPDPVEYAVDDTSVQTQPFRHVDYLSHSWKEEDIWSSWKHIVSQRKAYDNSARLENASWRTWTKVKNKLKTVSPESLNWLKDCDVTWLYGPLQTRLKRSLRIPPSSPASNNHIPKSNSFLNKKSILRKRSMSQIILQRSLSASSLLKQTAAVRVLSSGLALPGIGEKKRIHFNVQVEQCIALEIKGDDDEETDSDATHDYDDSDSDNGVVMMARTNSKQKLPLLPSRLAAPLASFSDDSKTIAMLPSTTLKYVESAETAMEHGNGSWNGCKPSPSLRPGTLRPSKPSSRILIGDDLEEDDAGMDRQPPSAFAPDSAKQNFMEHDSLIRTAALLVSLWLNACCRALSIFMVSRPKVTPRR